MSSWRIVRKKYLEGVQPEPENKRMLQMMAGLLLLPDTSYNVAFFLYGQGGTGKTVFTQGFAAGLGIKDVVNSPTFTILQVYEEGRLPLYHFDVYRIGDSEEMLEIGWDEYACGEGVCLVEWADLIEDLIGEIPSEKVFRVEIRKDLSKGTGYRRIDLD